MANSSACDKLEINNHGFNSRFSSLITFVSILMIATFVESRREFIFQKKREIVKTDLPKAFTKLFRIRQDYYGLITRSGFGERKKALSIISSSYVGLEWELHVSGTDLTTETEPVYEGFGQSFAAENFIVLVFGATPTGYKFHKDTKTLELLQSFSPGGDVGPDGYYTLYPNSDDSLVTGFGYQSSGKSYKPTEDDDDLLGPYVVKGEAFTALDSDFHKWPGHRKWCFVACADGKYRKINTLYEHPLVAPDNPPEETEFQPTPYIIEAGQPLTAISQSSYNADYLLIGQGTGTYSTNFFNHGKLTFKQRIPMGEGADACPVLIGMIEPIPGFNGHIVGCGSQPGEWNSPTGRPKLKALDTSLLIPFVYDDVTDQFLNEDEWIMDYSWMNSTSLAIVGYKGDEYSFYREINYDNGIQCHPTCASCFYPGIDKCLLCIPELGKEDPNETQGRCVELSYCHGVEIIGCEDCFGDPYKTCKKCIDGYGLNRPKEVGGTLCVRCVDAKCKKCDTTNQGFTCSECFPPYTYNSKVKKCLKAKGAWMIEIGFGIMVTSLLGFLRS